MPAFRVWHRPGVNANTPPATETNPPAPEPNTPPPPPAAATVAIGKTERESELAQELAEEMARHAGTAAQVKARETRIAELEDELHRLRETMKPAPAPARRESGWFFEEED